MKFRNSSYMALFLRCEILVKQRDGLHAPVELLQPVALVGRVDRILREPDMSSDLMPRIDSNPLMIGIEPPE